MTYSKYLERWDKKKERIIEEAEKLGEDRLDELIKPLKLSKVPCESCGKFLYKIFLYKIDEYKFYCKVCDEVSIYSFPIEDEYEDDYE